VLWLSADASFDELSSTQVVTLMPRIGGVPTVDSIAEITNGDFGKPIIQKPIQRRCDQETQPVGEDTGYGSNHQNDAAQPPVEVFLQVEKILTADDTGVDQARPGD
jgi:hypothetical protein